MCTCSGRWLVIGQCTCSGRWLVNVYLQWTVIGQGIPAVDGDWSMYTCRGRWLVNVYLQRTVIGQCIPAVDADWWMYTCSGRWLVPPGRTAPWSCGPDRWSRWIPRLTWGRPAPASPWSGTAGSSGTDRLAHPSPAHEQLLRSKAGVSQPIRSEES